MEGLRLQRMLPFEINNLGVHRAVTYKSNADLLSMALDVLRS